MSTEFRGDQAINISIQKANSEWFIEFMLEAILNTLTISSDKVTPQVTPLFKTCISRKLN
jgi:hypothetical protein